MVTHVPTTWLGAHLRWTRSGVVWATWRIAPLPYGRRPVKEKKAVRSLHRLLFRSLDGEALLLGHAVGPAAGAELLRAAETVSRQADAIPYLDAVAQRPLVRELIEHRLALIWAPTRLISDDPAKGLGRATEDNLIGVRLKEALGAEGLHLLVQRDDAMRDAVELQVARVRGLVVQQQQRGLGGQGTRQQHALALAAGELS